jgi:hypothetical protein
VGWDVDLVEEGDVEALVGVGVDLEGAQEEAWVEGMDMGEDSRMRLSFLCLQTNVDWLLEKVCNTAIWCTNLPMKCIHVQFYLSILVFNRW